MRLRIKDVNFTNKHDWLFELWDETGSAFYIMNDAFYKAHKLTSPIGRKELDSYDRGQWINVSIKQVDNKEVVVSVE